MQQTVTDILTGLCLFTYYVSGNSFRELGWVQKFWVGLSFENCMIHVQLTGHQRLCIYTNTTTLYKCFYRYDYYYSGKIK